MKNIFFFLTLIFPYTNQLTCLINCLNFKVDKGQQFQDTTPSDKNKCIYDKQATRCYGRIMIYYNRYGLFEFISYSLGLQKHIIEKEIEELAIKNRLKSLIYFLFLIESFDTDVVVITASIICQTNDNCALNYIKDLFNLYHKQKNPIDQFDLLHTNVKIISELTCYDYESQQIKQCLINQYPTCIIHDTNMYQQGCYFDQNMKLEYGFSFRNKSFLSS
jgi:hypothetical protein